MERHDYLLESVIPLPIEFSFTVQSHDKDDGMVFEYHWLGVENIDQLDWGFKEYVTPKYIPECFVQEDV